MAGTQRLVPPVTVVLGLPAPWGHAGREVEVWGHPLWWAPMELNGAQLSPQPRTGTRSHLLEVPPAPCPLLPTPGCQAPWWHHPHPNTSHPIPSRATRQGLAQLQGVPGSGTGPEVTAAPEPCGDTGQPWAEHSRGAAEGQGRCCLPPSSREAHTAPQHRGLRSPPGDPPAVGPPQKAPGTLLPRPRVPTLPPSRARSCPGRTRLEGAKVLGPGFAGTRPRRRRGAGRGGSSLHRGAQPSPARLCWVKINPRPHTAPLGQHLLLPSREEAARSRQGTGGGPAARSRPPPPTGTKPQLS